ncbi:MAG: hypothetical protein JW715_02770 [Sedimentisphaerales bacterium]|nr:hypothetical protein [Sedimentisphaerales bacterium]
MAAGTEVLALLFGVVSAVVLLDNVIVYGLPSILNGPLISTFAVILPDTPLGSRHESEHVPPQPYEKL